MRMDERLGRQKVASRAWQRRRPVLGVLLGLTALIITGAAGVHTTLQNSKNPETPVSSMPNERWNALTADLEKQVKGFRGEIGLVLVDLKTNREWTYQADRLFPSASLIKVPIMAAVFEKIKDKGLSLDTPLKLGRQDRMSGSGRLKWQRAGVSFTVGELLYYMITESDNTAMRILVNEMGLEYFQEKFRNFGLLTTNIEETGLKLSSRPVLKENYTTAREMADLLQRIYRGALVDKSSSQAMMELMKSLKHRERLAKPLPAGWQIAHKTGLLRRACHDVGIVFSPEGDYVLAVLTWKAPDYKMAKNYISRIGKTAYRYLGGETEVAAAKQNRVRG